MTDPESVKLVNLDGDAIDATREMLMMLLDIEDPNDEVLIEFFGFPELEEEA